MPTLLDLAKVKGNDISVGLIEESIQTNPELRLFPMTTIAGTSFKTLIRTGFPVARFRSANQGTPRSKSTFEQRLAECFIIDSQVACDKMIADAWESGGVIGYRAMESTGVTEANMRRIGRQTYYGNSATAVAAGLGDAKGFPGFVDAYDTTEMEVDAGGSTALSSVWFVKFGDKHVRYVAGAGKLLGLALPEWRIESMEDAEGNPFTAYVNSLEGWIGMQVASRFSVARIKKLGTDANKGLTDALGEDALDKFPSGIVPDYAFMTRRSRKQLRESRQAIVAVGGGLPASVPMPTDIAGIPIVVTDSISNAETF